MWRGRFCANSVGHTVGERSATRRAGKWSHSSCCDGRRYLDQAAVADGGSGFIRQWYSVIISSSPARRFIKLRLPATSARHAGANPHDESVYLPDLPLPAEARCVSTRCLPSPARAKYGLPGSEMSSLALRTAQAVPPCNPRANCSSVCWAGPTLNTSSSFASTASPAFSTFRYYLQR